MISRYALRGFPRRQYVSAWHNFFGATVTAAPPAAAAPASAPAQVTPPPSLPLSVVDGMTRFPTLSSSGGVLRGLDYGGTIVFAFTGGITAASYGLDLLGVLLVGTITAVGGGTLRDVVLFSRVPFWSGKDGECEYIYMSLAAAAAAFFLYPQLKTSVLDEDGELLQWGDAVGLGAFAVIGAQNGLRGGLNPLLCILCGISTATFGGLTRDVLVARQGGVRILHSHAELYATCAAAGAATYLGARALALPLWARIFLGVGAGVSSRCASWKHGLRLPTWSSMGHAALVLPQKRQSITTAQTK